VKQLRKKTWESFLFVHELRLLRSDERKVKKQRVVVFVLIMQWKVVSAITWLRNQGRLEWVVSIQLKSENISHILRDFSFASESNGRKGVI